MKKANHRRINTTWFHVQEASKVVRLIEEAQTAWRLPGVGEGWTRGCCSVGLAPPLCQSRWCCTPQNLLRGWSSCEVSYTHTYTDTRTPKTKQRNQRDTGTFGRCGYIWHLESGDGVMGVCTHPGSSHWTHGTRAFFACLSCLRKAAESKDQGVPPATAIDCKDPGSPGGPPSLLHLLLALKIPRCPFWTTALRTVLHCASCLGDRSRFRTDLE